MGLVGRSIRDVWPLVSSRTMVLVLLGLLAIDMVFMGVHIARVLLEYVEIDTWLQNPNLSIEEEGGYSEHFEYLKTGVAVAALLGAWALTRQPIYLALSALFLFALLDNAFQLHEGWGYRASYAFTSTERVAENAPQAFGELAYFAAAGVVALALGALAFFWSEGRHRSVGLAFLLIFVALGGFGVGIDLIHTMLSESRRMDRIFGFIEDGGELVLLSVGCALSCALYAEFSRARQRRLTGAGLQAD